MNQSIKDQLKGKKILFATVPADGHFNPLTGLAKYFQQAGADVRWYASDTFTKKLQQLAIPQFPYVKAIDTNAAGIDNLFPERKLIDDPIKKANLDIIHGLVYRSSEFYEDLQQIRESFPFDLLVSDSVFPVAPLVKHLMDIPVVAIGIMPLGEISVDLAPYGMGLLPPQNEEEQKKYEELRELASNVLFKESIDSYDALLKSYNISIPPSMLVNLLIKTADLYLQIGTPDFEYTRSDLGENIHFIGALFPYTQKDQHEPWFDKRLNEYKKVVLVTQGTVEKDVEKLIVPTLEAFEDTDVLVIATTGGSETANLREKYPQHNFIIEDYLPFNEVLPYTHAFITNGGYGGSLLSIKHGTPLIAAGVHEAKNEICARIGYFNYGINLNTENPTPEQLRAAVEEIIINDLYTNNVTKLAGELNSLNSNGLCAQHVVRLLDKIAVL
ncbi:MGT family glycosyltransferase [Pedobacter cryoconitis]|uniref:MGT family glycosyltransferase n=1 Tax=Pedobacter cryoconitis TaxID=188932 RepID=A0A7W8YU07_9SPHI|nr:nucleotide disphospho-sugar-binding domain-containing protein [Pedobacter cryoconitis]MBB5621776.1 MGT family glycosyltransferase [Pedobacter cryoconitis]